MTSLFVAAVPCSWSIRSGAMARERHALAAASALVLLAVLALLSDGPRGERRAGMLQAQRTALWDLEEGGPTDADQGFNYNPVVVDDAVSRRGYPALVTGWREWGCPDKSTSTASPPGTAAAASAFRSLSIEDSQDCSPLTDHCW